MTNYKIELTTEEMKSYIKEMKLDGNFYQDIKLNLYNLNKSKIINRNQLSTGLNFLETLYE